MIEVCNLTKKFGSSTVLENFSFSSDNGSICGLVGYNGAGKTTLLKIVAGIYRADSGEVMIDGKKVYENALLKRHIFMVQDEPYFLPQGSISSMSKFYKGYYPSWSDETCTRLSDIFGLDTKAKLNSFSKGMQRQAALILGLSTLSDYLLLDESFDGLDLAKRNLVKDILLEYIKKRATNILISSHNLLELEGLCNNIGIIRDKNLFYSSSVDEMRKNHTKYNITFNESFDIEALYKLSPKNMKVKDSTATFIYKGTSKDLDALLKSSNVLQVETMPMTLEEIFLEGSEEKVYDFKGLF